MIHHAESTPGPHGGATPAETDYRLPTSGGGTRLVIIGLLAGALSAGVAIAVLSFVGGPDEPAEPAAMGHPQTETMAVAADDATAPDAVDAAAALDALPEGVDETVANPSNASNDRANETGMRNRGTRSMAMVAMVDEPSMGGGGGDPTPSMASATELTDQARSALRDGDPRRCVELTGQALSAGAGPATARLRGDCLLGTGDRSGALAAYERFCRTAPTHPSANEVRAIVEGMGGSCE